MDIKFRKVQHQRLVTIWSRRGVRRSGWRTTGGRRRAEYPFGIGNYRKEMSKLVLQCLTECLSWTNFVHMHDIVVVLSYGFVPRGGGGSGDRARRGVVRIWV
jgi:hypothetical protein